MILLVCAIISGLCFGLSLPPFNFEFLMWFGVAPLFVAAALSKRPLEAVGVGLIVSVVAAFVQVRWPHNPGYTFLAYLPFAVSAVLFSVMALGASLARRRLRGVRWCLFFAALAIAGEWLTVYLPMPVNVALTQYRQIPIIQLASLTGIWGVSYLIWFTNAAVADIVLNRMNEANPFVRRRLFSRTLAVAAGFWAFTLGYGAYRLHRSATAPFLRVAAIQDCTGDETGELAPVDTHAPPVDRDAMTRVAAARGARMVVWSEDCLGSAFLPESKRDDTINLARALGIYMVVGYSADGPHRKPYNCAGLIAPSGQLLAVHHKIGLYAEETRTVERGRAANAFATPIGKLGMEICFDTCNTGITRRIASQGARLLLVPNFDPPTVRGILHNLHAALAPFRCVENAIPMVRDDSNGNSQVIDSHGRIMAQGPLYAPATIIVNVPLGDGRGAPFTRLGDWFAYVCLLQMLGFLVAARPTKPPADNGAGI